MKDLRFTTCSYIVIGIMQHYDAYFLGKTLFFMRYRFYSCSAVIWS